MASATLALQIGGTQTFVIEGLLRLTIRKSQQTPPLPVPTQPDSRAVLTAVMGQVLEISGDFNLYQRSDDYTGGTGTPGTAPYSIEAQKQYLLDTIFHQTGTHKMSTVEGVNYSGRIQDLEFVQLGDDPLAMGVVFRFVRGIVF